MIKDAEAEIAKLYGDAAPEVIPPSNTTEEETFDFDEYK
jgi:hypothetical protein